MSHDTRTITCEGRRSLVGALHGLRPAHREAQRPAAVILGLDAVLGRWRASTGDTLDVDDFAPTEDDRAVLTAALARVVEEGAGEVEDAEERRALEEKAAALHELFVTDVTRS